jgi:hypothetical protein
MDKNPNLKKLREKAENTYDKTEESTFQSKRPKKMSEEFGDDPTSAAEAHHAQKWLRRFRYLSIFYIM